MHVAQVADELVAPGEHLAADVAPCVAQMEQSVVGQRRGGLVLAAALLAGQSPCRRRRCCR